MNENDGESCPGAETCSNTKGKPLNRYPNRDETEVCKGCPLFPTKPEAVPEELATHVADALTLSELQRSGATFAYPDSLTAVEWASLSGLTRGLNQADGLNRERERKKQKLEEKKKRLKQNG